MIRVVTSDVNEKSKSDARKPRCVWGSGAAGPGGEGRGGDGGACVGTGLPQEPQKLAPGGSALEHFGHWADVGVTGSVRRVCFELSWRVIRPAPESRR